MTTIRSERHDGGVCVLTLDKPPANAIDERLLTDLERALETVAADATVRAVVLTGAGAFFCGGFDFAAPRREDAVATDLYALYRRTHLRLLTLAKPTLAMVNGHATAGGLVLVLACDSRLAAAGDARIGLNEVAVGAAFPRAAFEIVQLRLSHARATELILGAALYPVADGVRLGVIEECLPAAELRATVLGRAARLGAFPRDAYAHAKSALVREAAARIEAESDGEALATMAVWLAPESRAARARQRARLGLER